jgi:hypothetical protein
MRCEMTVKGRVQNGIVILDEPDSLPEGAEVRVEVVAAAEKPAAQRRGGMWKGQVRIADDFDDLPDDLAAAFGVLPD